MGDFGSGSLQPAGHMGRIPNFKNNHGENFQTRCAAEPPACVQNAMMTKDKKPFTYTPGGLDLSQIRTPSMARRLNKQQHSLEEQDSPTHNRSQPPYSNGGSQVGGGRAPPPPPPPPVAGPPPPPPLLIQAPNAKVAKPIVPGVRPEIVIPENPIGMLRKTHSPYHWESENAEKQNQGLKFVEKSATPSPVHPQMNAPTQFSQQPQHFSQQPPQQYYQQQKQPQTYAPPAFQENSFQNCNQGSYAQQPVGSPVHKPEPKYPNPQQHTSSPVNGDPNMRDLLQRQDSQFNNSPAPWTLGSQQNSPQIKSQVQSPSPSNQSPIQTNASSPWRKPDSNNSPTIYQNDKPTFAAPPNSNSILQSQNRNITPQSSTFSSPVSNRHNGSSFSSGAPTPVANRSPFPSPASPQSAASPSYSDRGHMSPQHTYYPTNNQQQVPPNTIYNNCYNPNQQEPKAVSNTTTAPWRTATQTSPTQNNSNNIPAEVRYQTSMSIPVTPRNNVPVEQPTHQKEAVYVTQEPVYYHNPESPKVVPGWVRSQKEKTPPPEWCQRANELGRKSIPRDTISQDKENNVQPDWVQKANELRKSVPSDGVSLEKDKDVQPPWVQKANELRRNIPNDMSSPPQSSQVQATWAQKPSDNRNIPVKMEVSSKEVVNNGPSYQTQPNNFQQPQLRIIIDMNQQGAPQSGSDNNAPYSQPTQRIMRALQPQLVRIDRPDPNLPSVNPAISPDLSSPSGQQPKTRIIPIRIEPDSPGANPKRVFYHKFTCEPPRQSKSFRVLQTITGTLDSDPMQHIEAEHGFTDL